MINGNYCIGVDYGTDSVRSILVDAYDGREIASSVFEYPRWKEGLYCDPSINMFRQHPLDYIEGLEFTIKELLKYLPGDIEQVKAISIDTTGSTPVAVDRSGVPLSLLPEFSKNPNAMFILWKDHTAVKEADLINALCRSGEFDYSKYSGGTYSSEWFWAKIVHATSTDERIAREAFSWVEHCDWLPALLTGNTDPLKLKRSRCAAGHKAMWNMEWGGLPPDNFLALINPNMKLLRSRLYTDTYTSDISAGTLSYEWAQRLGLTENVIIGVGGFDAHIGAVGGEIIPYYLSKVIGTSTCDMLIAPYEDINSRVISGISGQVDGSIIPGMIGMEAGQSAFGDVYAWFRDLLLWPVRNAEALTESQKKGIKDEIINRLCVEAEKIPVGSTGLVALDWLNGRRTPDANQHLRGAITGLTLGTDAPRFFKALVEATAFGSKMIVDRYQEQGIVIKGILALGGVAKKSPFVMQVLADVLNRPIKVVRSEHTCALGASMYASVIAGLHPDIFTAQQKMGKGFDSVFTPLPENVTKYACLFKEYSSLGRFVESEMR